MKKLLLLPLLLFFFSGFAQVEKLPEARAILKEEPTSKEAYKLIDEALKESPENEEAMFLYCVYYLNKEMGNYAQDYAEALVKANPENPKYRWVRANSYLRPTSSEEKLKTAISDIDYYFALTGGKQSNLIDGQIWAYVQLQHKYINEPEWHEYEKEIEKLKATKANL